ncbi:hypothetical protein HanRHA438_Chr00c37g0856491 [Helianthus annuus]|nr:hypothetical protein HanHA300_Chr03g0087631 [Helianthus annuus]KAJ0600271.1 hypothetical protein HanIR_Chr03g0114671 [Helianthus annuus]KAJ0607652.1 hypothetical protein HanHA89_Chr03g0099231 [Helianthus annuus]KAJ0767716.1 hypothetical protein HanLR1_Chr03g0092591 [Helianthus annuus]KAJ0953935.1 hypothetical protein HanRHA438_Chr00c37g0856491 [Helianthus annuus]
MVVAHGGSCKRERDQSEIRDERRGEAVRGGSGVSIVQRRQRLGSDSLGLEFGLQFGLFGSGSGSGFATQSRFRFGSIGSDPVQSVQNRID